MSAHLHLRTKKLQSGLALWLPLYPPNRVDCWCFDEALTFDIPNVGLVDNTVIYCEDCKDKVSDHIDSEDQWVNFTQMNLHNPHKDTCDLCGCDIYFDPIWTWVSENILIGPDKSVRQDISPDHIWVLNHIMERVLYFEPNNSTVLEKVVSPLEIAFQIAQRTYP